MLHRFGGLLERARATDLPEPTAMTLATVGSDGLPSARTVLLKGFDADGFVFYTNTTSRKGRELRDNPNAALCFYWQPLGEQVHVEGMVHPVTAAEADVYFATRPRESQVGAWASHQSEPLADREELLARVAAVRARYEDQEVPRPPHWSGYRLVPERVEFWTAGEFRLHHRVEYRNAQGEWSKTLLNP
ncbi:MAG: pyridoxamine 5'-phosphate oxidase [Gammaproteobacteria bacterium]|nr:pyridoxamine 5'-phosphate oxidase [Gammaproteobacteria bacterium]